MSAGSRLIHWIRKAAREGSDLIEHVVSTSREVTLCKNS
jgi:hypothetical protein